MTYLPTKLREGLPAEARCVMPAEEAPALDYKRILYVYLNHVGQCEGVTFVTQEKLGCLGHLTSAELEALREIEGMPHLPEKPLRDWRQQAR
jgi:hypothetical protein